MTFLGHLYMIGLVISEILIRGLVTGEFRIVELNVNFAGYKLNPFLVNVPILYPLKTPENLWYT